MKTISKIKKGLFILIPLALIAAVVMRLKNNRDTSKQKVYQYDKEKPILVETDTILMEMISAEGGYTGTFEPNRETKVSSEIQGRINSVLVDAGSYVSKGQVLMQLDNSLLKLQLQSADVQIEGLQHDVDRYTVLAQADVVEGIKLEKALIGLKSAKVQRATLLEQISKTTITAPFNGVVTARLNDEGGFAAPGVPLLQITDISRLRFTVFVPEKDLSLFHHNLNFSISADILPDIPLKGKVIMTGSKANPGNSFPVQFQVVNTQNLAIKSGMFGRVNLNKAEQEKGILIPSSAINEQNGKTQVYLVKNGKAVSQPVTVSKSIGKKTIVTGGLTTGDVIVTNGFINLFDNAAIMVK